MLFACPRLKISHSSEQFKVIYIKRFLFYVRINRQFEAVELKDVEMLVEQTVQALTSC